MKFIRKNQSIKLLFLIIFVFFLIRITSIIELEKNIYQLNQLSLNNWVNFFKDILSILILFGLVVYSIFLFLKKKFSYLFLLIIYPIFGIVGYYIGGYKNGFQDSILLHHFITLSSVVLFFSIIESDRTFDYEFKKILLNTILLVVLAYFILHMVPNLILKLIHTQDFRYSYKAEIDLYGYEFYIDQNVNGQTRILFILTVVCLLLFKKFFFKKKIRAHFFFLCGLLFVSIIYLHQARLNILATFIFSLFLILTMKDLSFQKKLIYILVILIIPIYIFDNYSKKQNRFTTKFVVSNAPYNNNQEFIESKKMYHELKLGLKKTIRETIKKDEYDPKLLSDFLNSLNILDNNDLDSLDIYEKKILEENLEKIKKLKLKSHEKLKINKMINLTKAHLLKECSKIMNPLDNLLSGRVCGWEILMKNIQKHQILIGQGFFADQFYLKKLEKTASNSWINILFNAGLISLVTYLTFIIIFLVNFFKIQNINNEDLHVSISHYLFIYFLMRSFFEDTLAFVSIDSLLLGICIILIMKSKKLKKRLK